MSEQGSERPAHAQILDEHRSLNLLFQETRALLQQPSATAEVREAVAQLLEAVEAHLVREESLYYPTLWALRPDMKPPLQEIVQSHDEFRGLLDALTQCLDSDSLPTAGERFEELARLFSEHEQAEETLLISLEQELEARH